MWLAILKSACMVAEWCGRGVGVFVDSVARAFIGRGGGPAPHGSQSPAARAEKLEAGYPQYPRVGGDDSVGQVDVLSEQSHRDGLSALDARTFA